MAVSGIARQRIASVDAELQMAIGGLGKLGSITHDMMAAAARDAARGVRPEIVRALMANLGRSGIESRTGKLRAALQAVICEGRMGPSGPALAIRMPSSGNYTYTGEDRTPARGKGTEAPRVWASLNYGAVRAGTEVRQAVSSVMGSTVGAGGAKRMSLLGQKAKRTVKQYALGGGISDRAISKIEQDVRIGGETQRKAFAIGTKQRETGRSVSLSGGAVVIKPRPFFTLSVSQRKAIGDAFANLFLLHLARIAG